MESGYTNFQSASLGNGWVTSTTVYNCGFGMLFTTILQEND